jgi:hypothetical protein
MTTRDSSTAATLAFQAEIASAKARRDRDQPRHSALPPSASPAPESNPSEPGSDTPDLGGKAA